MPCFVPFHHRPGGLYIGMVLIALTCSLSTGRAQVGDAQPASPGDLSAVRVQLYNWKDASRDRLVPVKIYYPADGAGPFPVVLFSHGLGGSRDGYEYLGRHWAGHGYVCVHLQHLGSDSAVWQGVTDPVAAMRAAATNLDNIVNRPRDVSFAIDELAQANKEEGPLKGRLDLSRIGMAGHSFGAYTTLMIAGQVYTNGAGGEITLADPRVKAAIAMSPGPGRQDPDKSFGAITIPFMHMTGTLDTSPINDVTPQQRRVPFDHSRRSERYLVTFQGGDHMVFSGRGRAGGLLAGSGDPGRDAVFQRLIQESTTAFWDAYLKGDARAKAWLDDGGLEKALAPDAMMEHRAAERE